MQRKLTPKQSLFVKEYLKDLNATQAAIRAGYSKHTANEIGAENLSKPSISEAIAAAMEKRGARIEMDADAVLRHWVEIATADANELMEMRRVCCRYCHGIGHRYQRTPAELENLQKQHAAACAEASNENREPPEYDEQGGGGYDRRKPPHPDCPECFGEGELLPFFKDTRDLSPAARKLYTGVKMTKEGLQVLTQDQGAALANVARHLGMFVDKGQIDLTTKGQPLQAVAPQITADQIAEALKKVDDLI